VSALDPNLNPFRPDLAAVHLRGQVEADRFVAPTRYQVSACVCPLRKVPEDDGEQLSQALHGDTVDIYEEKGCWGWGQMGADGYVGWFDMAALSAPVLPVTARVRALRTYALAEPSARAQAFGLLSLTAGVSATDEVENGFTRCERAGWVPTSHLTPPGVFEADPVEVALRFVGAPYQWGGVESLGLDCSGLIQIAHRACGIVLPRDSYMQRTVWDAVDLGPDPDAPDLTGLTRGDIVCWRGHVALMASASDIVHANGFHMAVVREPLADAAARIAQTYGAMLCARRFTPS
jgi:cell wall-associated NlpC family hydrolase